MLCSDQQKRETGRPYSARDHPAPCGPGRNLSAILLAAIFVLTLQRYIVRGLTFGAVKG